MITLDQLAHICPDAKRTTLEGFVTPLNDVFGEAENELNTKHRQAMFLANAAHESGQFMRMEENLNYTTVERLRKVFGKYFPDATEAASYVGYPRRIASRVYAGRIGNGDEASGDGWTYRGRGIFQVTGRQNYRAASIAICGDADTLLTNPDLLADPDYAVLSAAWYWQINHLASYADRGQFDAVCDVINLGRVTPREGDSHGFDSRVMFLKRAEAVLG